MIEVSNALKFEFDFSNSFSSSDSNVPVFLRHRGVRGSLRVENVTANEVEKVKVVLRGLFIPLQQRARDLLILELVGSMINIVGHGCPALYQPHKTVLEQTVPIYWIRTE